MAPHSTVAAINPIDGDERLPRDEEPLEDRLEAFVGKIESEAKRRVQRRYAVEERWIEDLRQYHGKYEPKIEEKLNETKSSRVFINMTAVKSDAMEARLWDLLFPTDDRNWHLEPTPVPELTEQAEAALDQVDKAKEAADTAETEALQMMQAGDEAAAAQAEGRMRQAEEQMNEAQAAADALHERLNEAKRRAALMLEEVDDQLVTCNFASEARDAIGDACRMGIGILKGPVIGEKTKQRWTTMNPADEDGEGATVYQLEHVTETMPAAYRVDPWSFFPDPDARRIELGSGVFERHLMAKDRLRKLARRDDIDKDAVRDLLRAGPESGSNPTYMTQLTDITGQHDGQPKDVYQVWEYTGPVETEDMELLLQAFAEEPTGDGEERERIDPLTEYHVRIMFCQGKVLSFAPHPLDSQETIYSCFTVRPDEASVFGFGIPYIMRHPQSILNGAWRMMMDNSGLSTGPQIVVNKNVVQPEDGEWTVTARKVWLRDTSKAAPGVPAFEVFNIPSNQQELANIIEIGSQTIDEVTAQPAIAQGEQGSGVTKTAQGMALLMNSANVIFRRIVKNYDDDMTVPLIRRFYHWNMQFSPKEAIKGDYEVQARGSGVLLVREMQAQNLLMIAQLFGDHPIYGPMLKHGELLRAIFRAHMIAADEITRTDRELKEYMAEQAQNVPPEVQAQMAKVEIDKAELELRHDELDAKIAMNEKEWDARRAIANLNYDAAMEKAAADLNMKVEELETKIEEVRTTAAANERRLAAEVAMKARTGDSSGGAI